MYSSPWSSCGPVDTVTRALAFGPLKDVIDWGCGPYEYSSAAAAVLKLPCENLLSIDGYAPYMARIAEKQFAANAQMSLCEDIKSAAARLYRTDVHCDLSLCLDVVEHLTEWDATSFLYNISAISRAVLIWIPLGEAPMEGDATGQGNEELMTHRSTWTVEKLATLGFKCEVLPNFHTSRFGWQVDGGWAWKTK